LFVAS